MVQTEFELGPLKVNLRVLLEPKGFLRIIVFFVALLAFATTAGFNSGSTSNSIRCTGYNVSNFTAYMMFSYPYDSGGYSLRVESGQATLNSAECDSAKAFSTSPLSTSAQFFVAMGVLSMIYVVGALLVYMFFITPELFLAKYLVLGDFFLSLAFTLLYLVSCIAWSVGVAQLNSYVSNKLGTFGSACLGCSGSFGDFNGSVQTFLLPAVSLILGWLATFIWASSLWFVFKDTMWHKDRTGPLASIYDVAEKAKESVGGRIRGSSSKESDQKEDATSE